MSQFKKDSIPSLKQHLSIEKLDSYLIYTHAKPIPSKIDTLKESRTCLRIFQSLVSAGAYCSRLKQKGAFGTVFYSSISHRYPSNTITQSGITFMCFTAIFAFLVAFSFITVYLFPNHLNIPPHRHPRFSRTEVCLDAILVGLWGSSASVLIRHGTCLDSLSTHPVCVEWISSIILGYVAMLLFSVTMTMGLKDLSAQHSQSHSFAQSSDHIMFAHGNWKD